MQRSTAQAKPWAVLFCESHRPKSGFDAAIEVHLKQGRFVILATAGLLLGFMLAIQLPGDQKSAPPPPAHTAELIRSHAPTLGRTDAPVVIVEFLDPACSVSEAFHPLVMGLLAEHPDKVRLVLRYAPFFDGSDKVLALLEAARRQGKFWPTLEALLASQQHWSPQGQPQVDLAWPHISGLGLDLEQLRRDMATPEVTLLIDLDLADADALGVIHTPGFFVNGKPLPRFGFGELKKQVDEALKDAR
jgi:protein-disulfide isomerase